MSSDEMSDRMDFADHLVAAARLASKDEMTKEQYMNCASVFWDSWNEINEFMRGDHE